jgi:hypothetical protein
MESVCLGKSRVGDGNSAGMAGTLGTEPLRPIITARAKVLVADESVDATGRSDDNVRVRILVAKHLAWRCAKHGVPEGLGRSRSGLRS